MEKEIEHALEAKALNVTLWEQHDKLIKDIRKHKRVLRRIFSSRSERDIAIKNIGDLEEIRYIVYQKLQRSFYDKYGHFPIYSIGQTFRDY